MLKSFGRLAIGAVILVLGVAAIVLPLVVALLTDLVLAWLALLVRVVLFACGYQAPKKHGARRA